MMEKQYCRFDASGYFLEDAIADYAVRTPIYDGEEIIGYDEHDVLPPGVTDIRPPEPNYKPRFDGAAWVEDAPQPPFDPETHVCVWSPETGTHSVAEKPLFVPFSTDDRLGSLETRLGSLETALASLTERVATLEA